MKINIGIEDIGTIEVNCNWLQASQDLVTKYPVLIPWVKCTPTLASQALTHLIISWQYANTNTDHLA
jgi:hypothetical protein